MKSIVSIMNGRGRGDGFDAEVFALASNEMNQPGGVSHVVVFEPVGGGTAFAQWADSESEARAIAANGLPGDGFDWDEYQRLAAAAKGGRKAARSLGKSGRKERASKAAAARWGGREIVFRYAPEESAANPVEIISAVCQRLPEQTPDWFLFRQAAENPACLKVGSWRGLTRPIPDLVDGEVLTSVLIFQIGEVEGMVAEFCELRAGQPDWLQPKQRVFTRHNHAPLWCGAGRGAKCAYGLVLEALAVC